MQLHLYVPDEVADAVRKRAESQGLSVSGYLAELVRREVETGWPQGFFDEVIGGWKGEPLERAPQGTEDARERWGE